MLAAIISLPRILRDPKDEISKLLAIYDSLPSSANSRAGLLALIEAKVDALVRHGDPRRDPAGIVIATMFLIIGTGIAWSIYVFGSWWWFGTPLVALLLVFGIFGLTQDLPKRVRDSGK